MKEWTNGAGDKSECGGGSRVPDGSGGWLARAAVDEKNMPPISWEQKRPHFTPSAAFLGSSDTLVYLLPRALRQEQTETILFPLSKSAAWFPMKIATRSRTNSPLRICGAKGNLCASGQLKISVAMMFCLQGQWCMGAVRFACPAVKR